MVAVGFLEVDLRKKNTPSFCANACFFSGYNGAEKTVKLI
jgi:hypothetical protein